MRVVFDGQVFSLQEYGGISRYFVELKKGMDKREGVDCELLFRFSNNAYLSDLNDFRYYNIFKGKRFKGRNSLIEKLNELYFKKNIDKISEPYIIHPTYYNPYFTKSTGKNKIVLTIYDLTHEKYPHFFNKYDHTIEFKKKLTPRADRIIAISESTKRDIIEYFNVDEEKIDVIHLGNSLRPERNDKLTLRVPENYFLFVGQRYNYKNFELLVKAASKFVEKNKDTYIVCAGGGVFKKEEIEFFNSRKMTNNILQMNVNDEGLAYLYSKAAALVFPSQYEGFGIPVLEAFASGCPVIASNSSSLPEIGGDAALYFDPNREDELAELIKKVYNDSDLRLRMISQGKEREKQFSWEKCVDQTIEVYNKVL